MTEESVVIYLRVSTARQGIAGNGIAAQRQACVDHLNGGDWHIIEEFVEQESGAKNARPELEKALAL
jgi:DNA invertase Pin-like site-specific DNA recombinase